MPVLLLRLAGPLQSWGIQSRFTVRDTGREPSKSGVVGLLCAALGVPREDDARLAELAALRMGVRVDQDGHLERDYHTAGGGDVPGRKHYGVAKADGSKGDCLPSTRYYLADASFLVGLEGDPALLGTLDRSLKAPRWPLFLGRKSFVPGVPVWVPDGLRDAPLEEALRQYAPRPEQPLRFIWETADLDDPVVRDQPLSFRLGDRRFGLRHVRQEVS